MDELRIEYLPLGSISKMPRNPKRHAKELEDSLKRYGYVEPILIDESSQRLVAGHGRLSELQNLRNSGASPPKRIKVNGDDWLLPVIRGIHFRSEAEAEEYGLSSNLLTIAGGIDEAELEEILKASELAPIGIDLDKVIEEVSSINEINAQVDVPDMVAHDLPSPPAQEDDKKEKKLSDQQKYDQLPFELQGVMALEEGDGVKFPPEKDNFGGCIRGVTAGGASITTKENSGNPWGIPNLRPDMLVESLPPNLKTWAGRLVTPDDGVSNWFWNYGASPWHDLPMDRSIISFFCNDSHLETWWKDKAYRVGQVLVGGMKSAVVPDFSLWNDDPKVLHLYAIYRAAYMGRYFQEAGLRVIPRLEYFMEDAKEFSLTGIPMNAPIVATQMHTRIRPERVEPLKANLLEALDILKPGRLLVYVGDHGREIIESMSLPCPVTLLQASGKIRKEDGRYTEKNPHLLAIRKKKYNESHRA